MVNVLQSTIDFSFTTENFLGHWKIWRENKGIGWNSQNNSN